MATASQAIYRALQPADGKRSTHTASGPCALCGGVWSEYVRFADAFGPSFTDYDRLVSPTSPWLCVPCSWSLGSKPPETFRLWSVVYRADRPAAPSNPKAFLQSPALHLTAKNDVREIVDVLTAPPDCEWAVAVASSGQKHTLPFAPLNVGAGPWQVQFEGHRIACAPDRFAHLLYHATELTIAGHNRDEIASGILSVSATVRAGVAFTQHHYTPLRPLAGSALLELVCFLLTPKEHLHDHRERAAGRCGIDGNWDRVHAGDDGQRVDRPHPPDGLVGASPDGTGAQRGVIEQPTGDGDAVREAHPRTDPDSVDSGPPQLSLFA
jgi:hypothetical protein